jgi:ceramide glucosyltransferase
MLTEIAAIAAGAIVTLAVIYATLTLIAIFVWRLQRVPRATESLPPVSVLKPLCGAEPGLYPHLRSYCEQDYPEFQLIFGVRDPSDPALAVVARLVSEFPHLPIGVVVNAQQHGTNCKISNLINMTERARHELLVMADSDTWVRPDYLKSVTAPLLDRGVGLVTCLYRDVPTAGVWSRLGAMYINEWYMPLVVLGWFLGSRAYVSGQTLCVRRATLEAIGGLRVLADHLADDYRLGELVRARGLRIVLSPYWVHAEHHEPDLDALTYHELRWMSTLRVLRPGAFAFLFPSFTLPLALLGAALIPAEPAALASVLWALVAAAITARLLVHLAHRLRGNRPVLADLWLLPLRDLLLAWFWCRSFFTSRITWRGNEFAVDSAGIMRRVS